MEDMLESLKTVFSNCPLWENNAQSAALCVGETILSSTFLSHSILYY